MEERERTDAPSAESQEKPLPLYLASFEALATINETPWPIQADILVTGQMADDQMFWVYEIRRFAVRSEPLAELGGPLSLAGPAGGAEIEPGPAGSARCKARLYYRALNELGPAYEEHDAIFPHLEMMGGTFAWQWEEMADEGTVRMRISLTLDEMVNAPLARVWKLDLAPEEALRFRSLREGGDGEDTLHSLEPCDSDAPAGVAYDCRALHVRFVSVSEDEAPDDLKPWVQKWIDSACHVWWEKGGIKIVPYWTIDQRHYPTGLGDTPGDIPLGKETGIILPAINGGVGNDTSRIDIYLADWLDSSRWGGVTHDAGSDQAYILLEIERAKHNKYLLAHELGHVLGLAHPDAIGATVWAGSYCSVMLPEKPISSRNTQTNLSVIEGLSPPLAPPVFQAMVQDTDRAPDAEQGFFHMVRDFPYDDGAEASVPESPFTDWWTHSDVWNSNQLPEARNAPHQFEPLHYADGSDMFNPDHSPIPTDPSCSGPNWMHVQLHACQPLGGAANPEVKVYLYLAVPGASSESLVPLIAGPDPFLTFSGFSLPSPSFPKTMWVQWNVPPGYPAHCCVFAVAISDSDPSPPDQALADIIADPAGHNFYHLFSRLKTDNDVAQRNLHIQGCAGGNAPFWSALPWVHMANPFDEAAAARLEIDTSQATLLQGLTLEVNGESMADIEIGGQAQVDLVDALAPEEHLTLCLRARLPANLQQGTVLPISLRFFVKGELVTGYRHLLRIVPLAETVSQVLDRLFGALQSVEAGCQVDTQELVEWVGQSITAAAGPELALGNLCARATSFSALAGGLETLVGRGEEWESVHRHLSQLAARLSDSADAGSPHLLASSISPNVLAEQIRDLADRIQEPAGRLARRRPLGSM